MGAAIGKGIATSSAFLMGRVLYEEWAGYWPGKEGDDQFGSFIDAIDKYVVSDSLQTAAWNNTTIVSGDVADRLRGIKDQADGDIAVSGSATLVRWLLANGLLDELRLLVHPIVVGPRAQDPPPHCYVFAAVSRVSGVAELVRSMILRGEIGPGRRLVELHLAERFGVGRSTLREALRRLEGEGLLVADPAGGMRVIALDADALVDTLHLRMALEALGAGRAARSVRDGRAAARTLRELELLGEDAGPGRPRDTPEAALLADRHFHRAVTALGAGRPCRDALEHVWDRLVIAAANSVPGSDRVAVLGHEHRGLVAAIAAGDEDAAAAIARRHVLTALGP